VLYFRVDDLEAELSRIASHGVWLAGFADPNGHQILLMQERPQNQPE
jgi:predicted enzyme related to lactoylglutathione lyase